MNKTKQVDCMYIYINLVLVSFNSISILNCYRMNIFVTTNALIINRSQRISRSQKKKDTQMVVDETKFGEDTGRTQTPRATQRNHSEKTHTPQATQRDHSERTHTSQKARDEQDFVSF